MKRNVKPLLISIAIPLLVGGIAGFLTRTGIQVFATLPKPPLSPPAIVFPLVWTILYTLMGISSYLIWSKDDGSVTASKAKSLYFYQLVVNFLWPIFFFNFQWYFFSFLWILLLWYLVANMIKRFSAIAKVAAYINIPYLIWLTFATYLNFGILLLNH